MAEHHLSKDILHFHRLSSFKLAGHAPRAFESPLLTSAERNIAVVDDTLCFLGQEILEHGSSSEWQTNRDRFAACFVSASTPQQVEIAPIEHAYPIVKTAAYDSVREFSLACASSEGLSASISYQGWRGGSWGGVEENWRLSFPARAWTQSGAADEEPRQAHVVSRWRAGRFGPWKLGPHTFDDGDHWLEGHAPELVASHPVLYPVAAIAFGRFVALFLRALNEEAAIRNAWDVHEDFLCLYAA
jgi:hypothetical protein